MSDGTQLVRYDAMCRAIAEAHAVDEVKDIRDKARAIEMYARQAQNTEAEERAREIRLRAERKCGQMLADLKAAGKMAKGGAPYHKPTGYVVEPVKNRPRSLLIGRSLSGNRMNGKSWRRCLRIYLRRH